MLRKTGTGISVTGKTSKIDDGLVDIFTLDAENLKSLAGAADRMLNIDSKNARIGCGRAEKFP